MQAFLSGVGLIAPGLSGWEASRPILSGERPYSFTPFVSPSPQILPPTERRRAGGAVRLALSVAQQAIEHACIPASEVATIFATADGDAENMHALCETLASDDRQVSPTRFHNSVQNAPSGYWTIAVGCHAGSNTISAPCGIAAQGLLEAVAQSAAERSAVMLVAYDLPMPKPLDALRSTQIPCGIALLFTPEVLPSSLARLTLGLSATAQESSLCDVALEALRGRSDVGRLLAVLSACARQVEGELVIEYAPSCALQVRLTPVASVSAA